jgi:hypothetical protein
MTALDNFKKVCRKYLILHDDSYLDVIFGTVIANRLDSKPVWLYVVGPPSSGKTEILQAIQSDSIIHVSRLGQYSLISFYVERDGDGKPTGSDKSLLPMLDGKTMIIKDFTAMINERRETLMTVAGNLRDAYDGASSRSSGTGYINIKSKFGLIAAVTNIIDRHRGILAELGERFLTYRCPEIEEDEATERCWRVSERPAASSKEAEMQAAAKAVLSQPLHKVVLSDSFRSRIIDTAQYVARARCEITRDRQNKEAEIPTPEIATRLTRQLCDLATGIAIVKNRRYISHDVERIVHKVALDCLTLKRLRLLKVLYNAFPNYLSSNKISTTMRYSKSAITRWLEDLHLLDLVERQDTPDPSNLVGVSVRWRINYRSTLNRIWG